MKGSRAIAPRWAMVAGMVLVAFVGNVFLGNVFLDRVARAQQQQQGALTITGLRIGIGGFYKSGSWAPVEVTVQGGGEPTIAGLEICAPDGDGKFCCVSSPRPIQFSAGVETKTLLYVKIGQPGDWIVQLKGQGIDSKRVFRSGDKELDGRLESNRPVIVTLGPAAKAENSDLAEDEKLNRPVLVTVANASELPTRWYGYDMLDTLVLMTSEPALLQALGPDDARLQALQEWIWHGGRVVTCVGRSAGEVLAPGAPLADLVPGKLDKSLPLTNFGAIESYAGSSDRLDPVGGREPLRIMTPRLADTRGVIELHEGSDPAALPLLIRAPRGFGELIYVAFDLDQPPFLRWGGRQALIDRILGIASKAPASGNDQSQLHGPLASLGFRDLSGQMSSALDQFTSVKVVPFALVALLIVIYILCIGPLDFLLVKRVLKRMEATWITFPAIVVAFSVGAYFLAYATKGRSLYVNQLDIVDVDVQESRARGMTWTNIFTPHTDALSLTLQPDLGGGKDSQANVLMGWLGSPGSSFGGMGYASAGMLPGGDYALSPELNAVLGMPVPVWSSKGVAARWDCPAPKMIEADLAEGSGSTLTGTLKNVGNLELNQCVLLYNRWAYPVGKESRQLASGGEFRIDAQLGPRTIDTFFKHSKFEDPSMMAPFDQESLDVPTIAETMMFFDAIGGAGYTQLEHRYQGFLDMSPHLKLGQAVLLCRVAKPAASVLRDGATMTGPGDQRWTFYRFLLNVKPKAAP